MDKKISTAAVVQIDVCVAVIHLQPKSLHLTLQCGFLPLSTDFLKICNQNQFIDARPPMTHSHVTELHKQHGSCHISKMYSFLVLLLTGYCIRDGLNVSKSGTMQCLRNLARYKKIILHCHCLISTLIKDCNKFLCWIANRNLNY